MHFKACSFFMLVVLFFACQQKKETETQKISQLIIVNQKSTVRTEIVKYEPFNYLIQTGGKIKAVKELKVVSENSGFIHSLNIYNNKRVVEGADLIILDTKSIQLKIDRIKENIFSSSLNYQSDLLSQASLLDNKSVGIKDTVLRKLKSNVGLTNAEFELKELQLEIVKSKIRAPFSGKIANLAVQKGQYIRSGDELFTIFSDTDLFLESKILESDIGSINIGQIVEISPVSISNKYKGIVVEINPIVDVNGLIIVKLKILNTKGLLPGMNASATILVPNEKSVIVPKSAVVIRNGKAVIFTYEAGLAKWNYVVVGRDNGKEVEILDGLVEGMKVIINNNLQLAHDSPVKEES